jgi:glycosyltransferase involved in cell wall biosynthesis
MKVGISVILPVHGDAPYLRCALNSVFKQEVSEAYEIVICFDRASRHIRDYISTLDQSVIRTVESSLPGVAHAHNAALFEASFDLIAVMHADDVMVQHRLEHQSRLLRKDKSLVCVGGQIELINECDHVLRESNFPLGKRVIRFTTRYMSPIAHSSAMYRTEVVRKLGGYRQEFAPAEDYDLWTRVLGLGEIQNSSRVVTQYRKHDGQISIASKDLQSRMKAKVARNYIFVDQVNGRRLRKDVQFEKSVRKHDETLHAVAQMRLQQRKLRVVKEMTKFALQSPKFFLIHATIFVYAKTLVYVARLGYSRNKP